VIDELTTTLLELKAARTTVEQVLDGLTLSADPSQGIAAAASSLERLAEQYSKTVGSLTRFQLESESKATPRGDAAAWKVRLASTT
jgi:hypothetical protein